MFFNFDMDYVIMIFCNQVPCNMLPVSINVIIRISICYVFYHVGIMYTNKSEQIVFAKVLPWIVGIDTGAATNDY